jgi:hypothetical protein
MSKSPALAKESTRALLFSSKGYYTRQYPMLFARMCQYCTNSFVFWLAVGIFTLSEPLICAYGYPSGSLLQLQILNLAISTVLYIIQLFGVATIEWEKIHQMQMAMYDDHLVPVTNMHDKKFLKLFIFFTTEGEYMFECACLVLGWASITLNPGIATLRCFRVYRLLWYVLRLLSFCLYIIILHCCIPLLCFHTLQVLRS